MTKKTYQLTPLDEVIMDFIEKRYYEDDIQENQSKLAISLDVSRGTIRRYLKKLGIIS